MTLTPARRAELRIAAGMAGQYQAYDPPRCYVEANDLAALLDALDAAESRAAEAEARLMGAEDRALHGDMAMAEFDKLRADRDALDAAVARLWDAAASGASPYDRDDWRDLQALVAAARARLAQRKEGA